jgi:predicted Zn-dependent protease
MKSVKITAFIALIALGLMVGCDNKAADAPQSSAPPAAADPAPTAAAQPEAEEEVSGQWVVSDTYGVKFRVPEDWQITRTEGAVSATAADGTTTVVLVGTESGEMIQSAINEMKSTIELKDVSFGKTGMTTINGLAGTRATGTAVLVQQGGDQEIQFLGVTLRVDKDTAVTMMIFSQAEMYEAQKDIIDGISQTIVKS